MSLYFKMSTLRRLYPASEGWSHIKCTLVSPITLTEEKHLAALIVSGVYDTPLEWGYSHQTNNKLTIVCRKK